MGTTLATKLKKFGPRLTVSLRSRDYDRLAQMASNHDASVSWVVRRAIDEYLAKIPDEKNPGLPFSSSKKARRGSHAA